MISKEIKMKTHIFNDTKKKYNKNSLKRENVDAREKKERWKERKRERKKATDSQN